MPGGHDFDGVQHRILGVTEKISVPFILSN
jgi:hypothetical protein